MALESIKGVGHKSLIKIVDFMKKENLHTILQIDSFYGAKLEPLIKNKYQNLHKILANGEVKETINKFNKGLVC